MKITHCQQDLVQSLLNQLEIHFEQLCARRNAGVKLQIFIRICAVRTSDSMRVAQSHTESHQRLADQLCFGALNELLKGRLPHCARSLGATVEVDLILQHRACE